MDLASGAGAPIDQSGANLAALKDNVTREDAPEKISEQHRRAGSPRHQAPNPADDGLQGFSLRLHSDRQHRSHEHDRQRKMKCDRKNPMPADRVNSLIV